MRLILAGVIAGEVREYRHVFVVYGNGHHAAQCRALVAAFGEPVYERASFRLAQSGADKVIHKLVT
jgi:hypothetical protein